jgi:apolipoprotein N-acyltransferase
MPIETPTAAAAGAMAVGVQWLRRQIVSAGARRRALVGLVAGCLSVLAMAPFFLSPVLFLTLPVLVWLIDATASRPQPGEASWGEARSAFLAGWWFGFGYFLLGLFWIGEAFLVEADTFGWLLPFAVTLMPAGLALFFGAATAGARLLWRPGLARILVLAVTLSLAEWLRGHILTGFPWNVLGYALTWPLALMQSSGLCGIYGLTLVAVVVFAAPLVLAADAPAEASPWHRWRLGFAIAATPLVVLAAYGAYRLSLPVSTVPEVALRIVQPSVPQRDKWRRDKQRQIFDDHLALSLTDAAGNTSGLGRTTHLVWPEAAMPFLPLQSPEALSEIAGVLGSKAQLLTGALRLEERAAEPSARSADIPESATPTRLVYNSLLVLGPGGKLSAVYDKIHLVPFGEYLPLQPVLEAMGLRQLTRLRGGFTPGPEPRPLLHVPGLPPLIALVCYEALFPGAVIQGPERPRLVVNVTNDGWFGDTTGPRQHFHQSRVRAVEEAVPIVRAANNGISAMIDSYGRIVASLGMNVRGVIDTALPTPAPLPLYARFGDLGFLLLALLAGAAAIACRRRA